MPPRKGRKQFAGSSIKPMPVDKWLGVGMGLHMKDGTSYSAQMDHVGSLLRSHSKRGKITGKQCSTTLAFCRNHFATHGTFPELEDLEKVFPYLKKLKIRTVWLIRTRHTH